MPASDYVSIDRTIDLVREKLALEPVDQDEAEAVEGGDGVATEETPDVFFTSLVGAKGLSAEHVFIVGLNDRHLPSKAGDDEICGFLVGLSRTRKRCHLISYRFFYKSGLRRSPFLEWVSKHLEVVTVNKDYEFAEASEETSQGGDGTTGGESTKSRDGEV